MLFKMYSTNITLSAIYTTWNDSTWDKVFGRGGVSRGDYDYPEFYAADLTAQNVVMFAFTLHMSKFNHSTLIVAFIIASSHNNCP